MYARTIIRLINFVHALSRDTHIFNLKKEIDQKMNEVSKTRIKEYNGKKRNEKETKKQEK